MAGVRFRIRSAALAALCLLTIARPAGAEPCTDLAGRHLTWIVPYTPGGGFDVEARLLAPHLGEALQAEVAISNISGAGGLVGAKAIRDAAPDGTTFGVVNGSGLVAVEVLGESEADAPTFDNFTVLGRTGTQRHVWMVPQDSPIHSVEDLIERGKAGNLTFGATDLGGVSFLATVLGGWLLGFEPTVVVGYRGSAELRVAVLRGDVDAMSGSYESATDMLESKELRALLQLSDGPISTDTVLDGVTPTGGPDGLAARLAKAAAQDVDSEVARASLVAEVTGMGRMIVAPAGLPPAVESCLASAFAAVLSDPVTVGEILKSRRSLEPLSDSDAAALARDVAARAGSLRPQIERALAKVRS